MKEKHAHVVVRWIGMSLGRVRVVWERWDVQMLVVTSLALQLLLILAGPLRKQTSNGLIIASIWLAYLLADWVAAQAVGVISRGSQTHPSSGSESDDLQSLWAQFLLLHLGGPDTITALAPEDNELWVRTALHLGAQGYFTLGILVKSMSTTNTTLIMFLVGITKYLERVLSLIYGRRMSSDINALDAHAAKFMRGYTPSGATLIPHGEPLSLLPQSTFDQVKQNQVTNVEMVKDAFYFFLYYKGLYADQQLEFKDHATSRSYFLLRTPHEAFRVLEIHLNITYEALYTKLVVLHTTLWTALRVLAMNGQVACLVFVWFAFADVNASFKPYDIRITYTLILGAIAVDAFGFLRIQLSDWNMAHNKHSPWLYDKLLSAGIRTWGQYWVKEDAPAWQRLRRAVFRRWSESIPQLNLVHLCGADVDHQTLHKVFDSLGVGRVLIERKYVTYKMFSDELRDFMFEDLWEKSTICDSSYKASYVCHCKGSLACDKMEIEEDSCIRYFLRRDTEYEDVLLIWHIFTEYFYQKEHVPVASTERRHREISKALSDYMLYLFVQEQDLISAVTGKSKHRLQKACSHIKNRCNSRISQMRMASEKDRHRRACEITAESAHDPSATDELLNTMIPMGLQKELQDSEKRWELMAHVWMELLCYAAIRCRASAYTTQLKEGGGLLAFIWLLMHQFGFGFTHSNEFDIAYAEHIKFNFDINYADRKDSIFRCPNFVSIARRLLREGRN